MRDALLKAIKAMGRRFFRRPLLTSVQTITEERLAELFLNAPENPLFTATLATLDLQVQDALDECLEETLTNEQMRYRLGGVAELLRFKENLQEREQQARRRKAEDGGRRTE